MISLGIAGIMLIASGAVFVYGEYLKHVRDADKQQLDDAQKNVKKDEIAQFLRLRDRLTSSKTLLTSHIELSQIFDVLENLTLQNVRYTSFKVTVAGDHTAQLDIQGQAKNFNSLASQSDAIAGEKRIKRAIFSGIQLSKNGTVGFTLTATVDASLVNTSSSGASPSSAAVTSAPAPAAAVRATTTPATTAPASVSTPVVTKVATTTLPAHTNTTAPQAPQTAQAAKAPATTTAP